MRYEAVRPLAPVATGRADSDGVGVHWELYGEGERTILLLAPWSLFDSRVWKFQVPYLAHRARVVVYDPPGNGRSDRPTERERTDEDAEVRYALAVMDAVGAERAVLAGISRAARPLQRLAAEHPGRVEAALLISAVFTPCTRWLTWFARAPFNRAFDVRLGRRLRGRAPLDGPGAYARFNAEYWRYDLDGFLDWFVDHMTIPEPYSSRVLEEARAWAHEAELESIIASFRPGGVKGMSARAQRALASRVRCPSLVIHGEEDRIFPVANARELARCSGGELRVLPGAGHGCAVRKPAQVNLAIDAFLDTLPGEKPAPPSSAPPSPPAPSPPRRGKRKRVLWWCSPLGLGHTHRDLAIARALRELRPEVEIDWLAESPVREFAARQGECVHPASDRLPSECLAFESQAREHHLHAMEAWRACNEVAFAEFMVFRDVAAAERYDLWVGDEAWGIDYHLHENPGEKRAPYVWLADFVGFVPVPSDGELERGHGFEWNAQLVEHVERVGVRDLSLFVGDPDDVVDESFGPGLPGMRAWTADHYGFTGYVSGYDPAAMPSRAALRAELGWAADEVVCVMSVGGSGAGEALLRRGIEAVEALRERVPGVSVVAVAGPRIDPARLPARDGLEVLPYVQELHRLLFACDVALSQGGLSTCMELAAASRPFIYVPLQEHFEQQIHVHHRLRRYGAGRRLDYDAATPEAIAAALATELGREQDVVPVDPGGARRAAERLAELL
jgi:pimeloyl-ACP methyl ester carboxylesterase/predicted glycosyltransferase